MFQTLGDCLGKGAFGSVYRALNWGTGETVAVKQVRLADLPKSELRVIMVSESFAVVVFATKTETRLNICCAARNRSSQKPKRIAPLLYSGFRYGSC